jgi:hypothetical protein
MRFVVPLVLLALAALAAPSVAVADQVDEHTLTLSKKLLSPF